MTANLVAGPYTATLVWKTNKQAPSSVSIFAGAGPLPTTTSFSPTSLTAVELPAGLNPFETVDTNQLHNANSNGVSWVPMGVSVTVTPATSTLALVSGNADLWTANAGYNQDFAIFVTDNGGLPQLVSWKESGGFGGAFSPNAAFAEGVFLMIAGHTYVYSLSWKTNHNACCGGATIFAGAGPIGGAFSPSRLLVDEVL